MGASIYFTCKQFQLRQDQCAMKVGTDAMILGSWANVSPAAHILDIGTGTGILALMAAQRNPQAHIHALEIDPSAAMQAKENFQNSPWKDRLSLFPLALQEFKSPIQYARIICNPPFFQSASGHAPNQTGRQLARHDKALSLPVLLECCQNLLTKAGRISLILPSTTKLDFIRELKWQIVRECFVRPYPERPAHRKMLELSREELPYQKSELILTDSPAGPYTEDFRALTKAFYLIF